MKKVPTIVLRLALGILALAITALCIFALPAVWTAVPDEYPRVASAIRGILALMYVSAVPFFAAMYAALRLLNLIDKGRAFSLASVRLLRAIAYDAVAIAGLYALSLPLFYLWAQDDDAPGLIVIGMIMTGASLVVALFAVLLQRLFGDAFALQTEQELTV